MGCTKSQVLVLLEYIERECRDAGSLDGCLSVINVIKERVREVSFKELLSEIYR